jgi:NB-ARC domain
MGVRASLEGLEIVNKARKRKGWTKTMTVAWWQGALTSQATLKRFWRQQPIEKETFIRICEMVGINVWQDITANTVQRNIDDNSQDLSGIPDISGFYGRSNELSCLEKWIVSDSCRVVALLGIGGIRKTYLAATFVDIIQDKFNYILWRSLSSVPTLPQLLSDIIKHLGGEFNREIPALPQLINLLVKKSCLIILDDFNYILQLGDYKGGYLEGYEEYGELIKELGGVSSQICLLLVSREKPKEIAAKEGKKSPIRSLQLTGLQFEEAKSILQDKDLIDENNWEELVKLYRGNPFALQIVASVIQELFNGSVREYLRHNTIVLGDISDLLAQQFFRLSPLEKEIIYWLAINRQPTLLSKLQSDILSPVSTSILIEVLTSLGRRYLIEKYAENVEIFFTLQPMVMKFVSNQFVNQLCNEVSTGEVELLNTHCFVKVRLNESPIEFPYRPIFTLVKDRLINMCGNKAMLRSRLETLLLKIKSNAEINPGYAEHNIILITSSLEE